MLDSHVGKRRSVRVGAVRSGAHPAVKPHSTPEPLGDVPGIHATGAGLLTASRPLDDESASEFVQSWLPVVTDPAAGQSEGLGTNQTYLRYLGRVPERTHKGTGNMGTRGHPGTGQCVGCAICRPSCLPSGTPRSPRCSVHGHQ